MFTASNNKTLRQAILISVIASPFTFVYAEDISIDSSIKAVTVYPGSAKITRVSNVSLKAGENNIIINNLPINLNETSLRITGESDGIVSMGSVEFSRDIQKEVVQEQEKRLLQQIEAIQEKRKVINDAITRNNAQLEYIKKMVLGNNSSSVRKDENTNSSYSQLPIEKWELAWKTLDEATQKAQKEIRESNSQLKNNQKELSKLKRELQQIATNQKELRTAKIKIDSDSVTELILNLNYQINGARWEPVYDMDLNTETGEIKIKTLAQISQRTGEDWKGVNVTLSTLRPSAGTQLPQLNPWVLDFMPDQNISELRSYDSDMVMDTMVVESAPQVKSAVKAMRKVAPMRQQQSRLISADFSAEYQVPGNIDLRSGSNKRRFALNSNTLASTIKLASSPRYDPRAMILATTKYIEESPLLAGSMSLFRNGNYVGNSFIQQKQSGEEIKLSFGEDDKVKIKFMPDPDKKRKDGLLFGKKKVVERHYKVTINSNHNKAYPISISDVIPIGSDENINVKRLGEAPSQTDIDDKKGVVSWDKTLKAKGEMKIKYGYSVSYPEGKIIPSL